MLVFDSTEEIAGLRKRWNPTIVELLRVPSDVVEVQVGTQDGIDVVGCDAYGLQVLHEVRLQMTEDIVFALSISADATIDDDVATARFDDEPLKIDDHAAFGRRVVRL